MTSGPANVSLKVGRYGPRRDDGSKLHPDLVAYEHLTEVEKAYDRETAQVVVAELLRRGLIDADPA